jgi:hypothetical protein
MDEPSTCLLDPSSVRRSRSTQEGDVKKLEELKTELKQLGMRPPAKGSLDWLLLRELEQHQPEKGRMERTVEQQRKRR